MYWYLGQLEKQAAVCKARSYVSNNFWWGISYRREIPDVRVILESREVGSCDFGPPLGFKREVRENMCRGVLYCYKGQQDCFINLWFIASPLATLSMLHRSPAIIRANAMWSPILCLLAMKIHKRPALRRESLLARPGQIQE